MIFSLFLLLWFSLAYKQQLLFSGCVFYWILNDCVSSGEIIDIKIET